MRVLADEHALTDCGTGFVLVTNAGCFEVAVHEAAMFRCLGFVSMIATERHSHGTFTVLWTHEHSDACVQFIQEAGCLSLSENVPPS